MTGFDDLNLPISILMSSLNFMFSSAEHETTFITSGLDFS